MKQILANDFEKKSKINFEKAPKIGIVAGSFTPLHAGHMRLIGSSQAENDITIVIVSGPEGGRGHVIPILKRYAALREAVKDMPNTYAAMVMEEDQTKDGNGWTGGYDWNDWNQSVAQIIATYTNVHLVHGQYELESTHQPVTVNNYVGQADYVDEFKDNMPMMHTIEFDRFSKGLKSSDLSGTKIRENPMAYWDYINPAFRRFFRKIILIAGPTSVGKSTLVKELAAYFDGLYTTEFARDLAESYRHTYEPEINFEDYLHYLSGQLILNEDAANALDNSKVVFLDTDSISTHAYLKMQDESQIIQADYDVLQDVANRTDQWTVKNIDMILFLNVQANGTYVEDGQRTGVYEQSRQAWIKAFKGLIHQYGIDDKLVELPDNYQARYQEALRLVSELLDF